MKSWTTCCAAALVALVCAPPAGLAAQAGSAQPAFLLGEWTGTGELFGQAATFSMTWSATLEGRFYRLAFRNALGTPGNDREILRSEAYYGPDAEGAWRGNWFDTRGKRLELAAEILEGGSVFRVHWVDPGVEEGQTIYRSLEGDRIAVTDLVVRDGELQPFGSATYARVGEGYDPTSPPPLSSHAMAFDAVSGGVVLFGGTDAGRNLRDELWRWDGSTWTLLSRGGPAPRLHFAMASDVRSGLIVLHGGILADGSTARDTWAWDGRAWTLIDETGPALDHHAMAYDASSHSLILFGGQDGQDAPVGDTWRFTEGGWARVAMRGPEARSTHRLASDGERVLLFGGWGAEGHLGDTWAWDGRAWRPVEGSEGPAARGATRLAWHAARRALVVFGGLAGDAVNGETWTLEDGRWERAARGGPDARNVHAMAYDPLRERVVLYGGIGVGGKLADTWEWTGETWVGPLAGG